MDGGSARLTPASVLLRTERLELSRFTPADVDHLVALDGSAQDLWHGEDLEFAVERAGWCAERRLYSGHHQ